MYNTFKCRALF